MAQISVESMKAGERYDGMTIVECPHCTKGALKIPGQDPVKHFRFVHEYFEGGDCSITPSKWCALSLTPEGVQL